MPWADMNQAFGLKAVRRIPRPNVRKRSRKKYIRTDIEKVLISQEIEGFDEFCLAPVTNNGFGIVLTVALGCPTVRRQNPSMT
jgi:hypothetical protein